MIKMLKELRKKYGVSQQQLADVIGVSQQSVNKYENHFVEPDIDTLIKIADYFSVSVDYLIGRIDTDVSAVQFALPEEEKILKAYKFLTDEEKQVINLVISNHNK